MRTLIALLLTLSALLAPLPACAQNLSQVKSDIAAVLGQIEGNLIDKEAIAMNFKVWKAQNDTFSPRLDDYNRRMDEANASCQGTFEHDEYLRRKAQCDALYAQLDTLKAQLDPEFQALSAELSRLQARDATRMREADGLQAQLTGALKRMAFACASLSSAEYTEQCRIATSAGPRTAPIVTQINADLAGHRLE